MKEFIIRDGKKLRLGYTTGSCAAAAAKAAAWMLLSGSKKESIRLLTPKGMELTLAVEDIHRSPDCVRCAIRKDSGDDPDITRDTLIYAEVRKTETVGIVIDGGQGIGRVTKPGLDQPVGAAAINSVPRLMIREAVEEVCGLFGYTGGATVACAKVGAEVCHVDAAKGMVLWARENRELSGVDETRVRWIIDDALKFVQREKRRGKTYDGLLMDPPSYGRGPGGEVWKLENELYGLVEECAGVLSDKPLFFLINSYTTGLQPAVLSNMLRMTVSKRFGGTVDAQEVVLPVTAGGVLPCGASGRWQGV